MLIYDIEIVKAITPRGAPMDPNIEYCAGWHDHENMGVSCICAYDMVEDRYHVFCKDNMSKFVALALERDVLVGFNNINFDNKVLAVNGFDISDDKCYDLLREIWVGDGLSMQFDYETHMGYGLDAVCAVNFAQTKSGNGAEAPAQWQRGEIGTVIDYCLDDVRLTKMLLDKVIREGRILSPKKIGKYIKVARPLV